MGPNPIVIGIIDESDRTYAKPLYAYPAYTYGARPRYAVEDMIVFQASFEDKEKVDKALVALKDISLRAEVHRLRTLQREGSRLEQRLYELERVLADLDKEQDQSVKRLERAGALDRVEEEMASWIEGASSRRGRRA